MNIDDNPFLLKKKEKCFIYYTIEATEGREWGFE